MALYTCYICSNTVRSGKSSLLLATLGLLPYSGSIVIDGIELGTASKDALRTRITTVTQDGVELKESIRANVYPFGLTTNMETVSDAPLIDVLRRVGLWDFILLHGGLDAPMSDMNLSHGQKQLLYLARAVLRKEKTGARIVLVDEATSNLDLDTDGTMQRVMGQAFAGCTVLVVSHRPHAIEGADFILEMDNGRIHRVIIKGDEATV